MLRGTPFSPIELFRVLRHRRWLIAIPFVIGLIATPFAAAALLHQYRAEATLAVATVPTEEGTGASKPASTAARLASARNRVLNESQLEPIIREFALYSVDRRSGPITELVQRIRSDIDVQSGGGDVVRVGYRNQDPKVALAVTARLASVLVSTNSVAGTTGTAERFTIKVAPTLPDKPMNDVWSKAAIYGGLIGLVVGFALAILQESRDLTLLSEDDVRRVLSLPVLGAISLMSVEPDRKTRRRPHATRGVGFAFLLSVSALMGSGLVS